MTDSRGFGGVFCEFSCVDSVFLRVFVIIFDEIERFSGFRASVSGSKSDWAKIFHQKSQRKWSGEMSERNFTYPSKFKIPRKKRAEDGKITFLLLKKLRNKSSVPIK